MDLKPIVEKLKGRYIVFEGMDGSGKTTIIERFKKDLKAQNLDKDILFISEPSSTRVGQYIREILLNKNLKLEFFTEMLLFMAARNELINKRVYPALKRGKTVISDRSIISSFAYQLPDKEPFQQKDPVRKKRIFADCGYTIYYREPTEIMDLIVYLDIEPALSVERVRKANKDPDNIEKRGLQYYENVSMRYWKFINNYTAFGQKVYFKRKKGLNFTLYENCQPRNGNTNHHLLVLAASLPIDEVYNCFLQSLDTLNFNIRKL